MFRKLVGSGLAIMLGVGSGCDSRSNRDDFLAKVPLTSEISYVLVGSGEPKLINGRVEGVDLQVNIFGNPNKVKRAVLYTRDKKGNIELDRELVNDGCCVEYSQGIKHHKGVTYIRWNIHNPENKHHLILVEDWNGNRCDDCPNPSEIGIASKRLKKDVYELDNQKYGNH